MPISPLFSKYSISCYFFPLFSNANSVYRLQNYELFPEVRHIPQNIYSFLITFAEQTTENGNVYGDGFFNNTKVFDFIEGESDKAFKVSLRYKKLEKLHKSRQNTW